MLFTSLCYIQMSVDECSCVLPLPIVRLYFHERKCGEHHSVDFDFSLHFVCENKRQCCRIAFQRYVESFQEKLKSINTPQGDQGTLEGDWEKEGSSWFVSFKTKANKSWKDEHFKDERQLIKNSLGLWWN